MSAFFEVLGTCTDSRFVTAITIKNNEYLAGTLTDVADLTYNHLHEPQSEQEVDDSGSKEGPNHRFYHQSRSPSPMEL